MTALVEDMLLLARLDAGRPLGSDEVDLESLAVDAVADAHAAGPDHVWQLDLPDGPDWPDEENADDDRVTRRPNGPRAVVLGDDHRLQQVLVNLLSNARIHTPPGTTVRTTVRTDGDRVTVRVQDNGPGIPEPLRPTLFQRFTRGSAGRSPGTGSTGLGLAIVDAVVRAHGGRIDVDTTPGATAFTVSLPAAP
jgi:two-component system OmpR family sensor kinase